MPAASNGLRDIVELLLSKGADIEAVERCKLFKYYED